MSQQKVFPFHKRHKASSNIQPGSIIGFSLDEATGPVSQDQLSALIVDEDGDAEGERWEPPGPSEILHSQAILQTRTVGEESSQSCLKEQSKGHVMVLHSLLEEGELPGFTDDQVSPLHNDDGHEESCVTSVLQLLPLGVGPFLSI